MAGFQENKDESWPNAPIYLRWHCDTTQETSVKNQNKIFTSKMEITDLFVSHNWLTTNIFSEKIMVKFRIFG